MPIRPEMKARYPRDWKRRSRFVRFIRAKNRCEWCGAKNGKPHPITGSTVVLTAAHVFDHRPEAASLLNLAALCQKCHNGHDAKMRSNGRKERSKNMKNKKQPKKKSDISLLIGSRYFWRSDDPLNPQSDIKETSLGHRNPIKAVMMQENKSLFQRVAYEFKLKWKVMIEVELSGVDREHWPEAEILIHGVLCDADGHFQEAVKSLFEDKDTDMSRYVTTRMKAEVIGIGPIEKGDFSFDPDPENEEAA